MIVYPVFRTQLLEPAIPIQGIRYKVERYSRHVIGGSDKAIITVTGNAKQLYELLQRLNYDVLIKDKWGEVVWNGFIAEVRISVGFVEFGISMDKVVNKLKIKYTTSNANGTVEAETTWAEDTKSQALYGIRELVETLNQTDQTGAESKRGTHLDIYSVPVPTMQLGQGGGGTRAVITCLGYLYTMNNRYYAYGYGREQYIGTSPGREGIHYSVYHHTPGQSFQLPTTQSIEYIHYLGGYEGSPDYNIVVSIRDNTGGGGGYPGTELRGCTPVAESTMVKDDLAWVKCKLTTPITLSPSTTYWIHWRRDVEGNNSGNYAYVAHQGNGTYANGKAVTWEEYWENPQWVDLGGDMCFIVEATIDTASKIADIALGACEYITGVHTAVQSGITTPIYRKGDYKALEEILTLASQGTTNKRRIRINLFPDRTLGIYEEAAYNKEAPDYLLEPSGRLIDRMGRRAVGHRCPVGSWVKLKNILPPGLGMERTDLIDHFYIESSEYTPSTEKLTYQPRGDLSSFDLGGEFSPG